MKEEKEPPQGMLDIMISRTEGIRSEIVQGREEIEKEIKKEINGLAQRIECIEERWKRKEENRGSTTKEKLDVYERREDETQQGEERNES